MSDGVTTAIVLFLLLCVAFPQLVKSKTHYYAAFFAVLVIILLAALASMFESVHFAAFVGFTTALLQIVALICILLAAGGLTPKELLGEMREAVDEIRHGESGQSPSKVVPITGQMPQPKRPVVYRDSTAGDQGPVAYKIDDGPAPRGPAQDESQIPLE